MRSNLMIFWHIQTFHKFMAFFPLAFPLEKQKSNIVSQENQFSEKKVSFIRNKVQLKKLEATRNMNLDSK